MGSLIGTTIISKGRRRCLILIQTFAIGAAILTMFKSLPMICLGRFLQGSVACTANLIMGKTMSETVPEALAGQYGTLTNIFVNVGFLISFSCGLLLPQDESEYATDEMWKLVSIMPAIVGFIAVMLVTAFYPEEPIAWCVANDRNEEASSLIKRVYSV